MTQITLSSLARIQKRIQNWYDVLKEVHDDSPAKNEAVRALDELRAGVAQAWRAKTITPESASQLEILQAKLESLNEKTRFLPSLYTPLK